MMLSQSDLNLIVLLIILAMLVTFFVMLKKFITMFGIYVQNALKKNTTESASDSAKEKRMQALQLQAHERMVLFVERIKPDSMILRTQATGLSCRDYQILLLNQIRNEYEYNLSQQLYLSTEIWNIICDYKNKINSLVNTTSNECTPTDDAQVLIKKILEKYINSDISADPILNLLRYEINNL